MIKQHSDKNFWILTPTLGSILFVILYIVATFYYPGGSQVNKNSIGFSWANNYWCNLLNSTAINGQVNPAKPIAIAAMLVLCLSLSVFWFLFPQYTLLSRKIKLLIQVCGVLAMLIGFFLFSNINHDLITNLASLFGLVATIGTFIGLYKNKWHRFFKIGIVNIFLVLMNNFFYYDKAIIIYLPVLQKITFATFLIWICWINVKMFYK